MPHTRTPASTVRVILLLGAVAVIGFCAVEGSGPDVAGDLWPVGLLTGVLCVASAGARPLVVASAVALAVATMWAGGRPSDVALGLATGAVAGSWVVWRLACGPRGDRTSLVTDRDFTRFLLSTMAGAGVAGLVASTTSAVTGWNSPALVGLATALAHLAAQLVVLPFFLRMQERPTVAPSIEVVALWGTTALVTGLVFASSSVPALVFLVIPVLVWGAMRVAPRQALWQVAAVSAVAITMTMLGFGRFASSGGDLGLRGYEPTLFAELFVVACVLAVVPLLLNVGQRVDSARDAAAADDNLRQVMESALAVAIIGTDPEGRITFFSPGAQRLLGYEPGEVLGGSVRMFFDPAEITAQAADLGVEDDFGSVMQHFLELPRYGPGRDLVYRRRDGQPRTHSTSVVKRTDGRGEVSGYVITSDDVTERVRAQECLVEALEVERRAVDRLHQVDQIKDDLISTVSHELRTPITSIVGYLELFEDGAYGVVSARQVQALERVTANSGRLLTLIDKLLTLSQIQEDGSEVVDETMDLRAVVQAGYDVAATESRTRGLDVLLELPSEPVAYLGDGEMLERVVVNLVDNAIKFTPHGGLVGVGLSATADEAVIVVTDTGIGIPHEEQGLLFTRFFRSSLAKREEIAGSGLGLSIARAVVEMHGGTLQVESSPGAGTTFEARLPRRQVGHVGPPAVPQPHGESVPRLRLVAGGRHPGVGVRPASARR
ncbi:ATP-binding protein [Nocardioides sp. URHA0020]|uniref:ATP-binding protein n=1 Tax=Nocardioides sp. URHA0020 TaxID=1380392 RepID=UPI000491A100|nr:ATP-binding protein [Nocardioides sp. URHA0020]